MNLSKAHSFFSECVLNQWIPVQDSVVCMALFSMLKCNRGCDARLLIVNCGNFCLSFHLEISAMSDVP